MEKICSECGLPFNIGRTNAWRPNGVIIGKYPPHLRGTIYDVDELKHIFRVIGDTLGLDISRLIIEGKRKDAKRFVDAMLNHFREVGRGSLPPRRDLYDLTLNLAGIWGIGVGKVIDYQEGERIVLSFRNAYSIPMIAGDTAGAFESIEGVRVVPLWEGSEENLTLTMRRGEGEPELEERIVAEIEMGIPSVDEGDLEFKLCGSCGAPLELSKTFEWDAENALITEKLTGKRGVIHNTNGIVAVVKILVEELGEDMEQLIVSAAREYSREVYTEVRNETVLEAELGKFPLRSWGRPVRLQIRENRVSLRIDNPYLDQIVAGRVWGLFEAFHETEYKLELDPSGSGYLEMQLRR